MGFEEFAALVQRHGMRAHTFDIRQGLTGQRHQVLADLQIGLADDGDRHLLQQRKIRQDTSGQRILDGHHSVIDLPRQQVRALLPESPARTDFDFAFNEILTGGHVVKRGRPTLNGDFERLVHCMQIKKAPICKGPWVVRQNFQSTHAIKARLRSRKRKQKSKSESVR